MIAKEILKELGIIDTLFNSETRGWVKGGLSKLMEQYASQQCQKRDELIKVQDEYITYLMKLVRTNGLVWDISLGARQNYEKDIEQLKKELK